MTFKYRSRNDIIAAILQASLDPIGKTKIMYKAFISHGQLTEYLDVLTQNDLLHYDELTRTYVITENGYNIVKSYGRLDQIAGLTNLA